MRYSTANRTHTGGPPAAGKRRLALAGVARDRRRFQRPRRQITTGQTQHAARARLTTRQRPLLPAYPKTAKHQ